MTGGSLSRRRSGARRMLSTGDARQATAATHVAPAPAALGNASAHNDWSGCQRPSKSIFVIISKPEAPAGAFMATTPHRR